MRKLFAITLALALIMCGAACAEVAGSYADAGGSYTYYGCEYIGYADGTACLTGYTGTEEKVVLPSKLGSHTLTEIGEEAFADNLTMKELIVPAGVTAIRARAFYNCSSLTSVTLPESLDRIDGYAFTWCEGLSSLVIPASVHSIGLEAFSCCDALTLTVQRGSYAMRWCMNNDVPYNCGIGRSGSFAYTVLSDDTAAVTDYTGTSADVTIPAELDGHAVSAIAGGAFSMNSGLVSVVIPDSVTSLGDDAFAACEALSSVTVPSSVTETGSGVFSGCGNVTLTVDAGSAAEALALAEGINLSYIEYVCGDFVYTCTADDGAVILRYTGSNEIVDIPTELDGLTVFSSAAGAFTGNETMKRVNVSFTVDSLGERPFEGCTALEYISVSPDNLALADIDGVMYIKSDRALAAYPAGRADAGFTVPEGILTISDGAFRGAQSLVSVTLPSTLTGIGSSAFEGCIALARIDIPAGVTSLGDSAFAGCTALKAVLTGDGLTDIGEGAFADCQALTSIELPAGLASLGANAFRGCSSLASFAFPQGLDAIADGTFADCLSLTAFEIPGGVISIGKGAFRGCAALGSVIVPDSVTAVGEAAFEGCEKIHLTVGRGSAAREYAQTNGIDFIYPDSYDWLNG